MLQHRLQVCKKVKPKPDCMHVVKTQKPPAPITGSSNARIDSCAARKPATCIHLYIARRGGAGVSSLWPATLHRGPFSHSINVPFYYWDYFIGA
ncbi:hypothetical protein EVAR_37047_1 [Eumeta japonica]|uniref:Uncharacterized protein n=1 Tax=Eumeta variegata TaxID=151549 RepID=A0A4C1WHG2_EUMVA|nr:hypothetical protein EVAR_37047_1 [Eumeta japonica]